MANWYDNVPAPVDANGREVPLNTRELVFDGKVFEVGGLAYRNVECSWVADLVGFASKVPLSACTLPDSWERLERDVMNAHGNNGSLAACLYFGYDGASTCVGCPASYVSGGCYLAAFDDILRRVKALAGVADDE